MKEKDKKNIKKMKNILSDETTNGNNDFDILFLVDATANMSRYITAARDETKKISDELRRLYPQKMFQYGYIFYRDPIDVSSDQHEVIDLTDDVKSLTEKIFKINATGGGYTPKDWAGAFKLANEKISWRNGIKVIIHLAGAGAHGKLFSPYDKYPKEESKLIAELEKCAEKGIKIFGYVINSEAQNSFNECSKIYRNKGGSCGVFQFETIPTDDMMMNRIDLSGYMCCDGNPTLKMIRTYSGGALALFNGGGIPYVIGEPTQMNINMNFRNNAIESIKSIMNKP